jgi:outer membrane lipoprotein-sorting protein
VKGRDLILDAGTSRAARWLTTAVCWSFIAATAACQCAAETCAVLTPGATSSDLEADPEQPLTLEAVLAHTQAATGHIRSLESKLVYEFLQPFHESRTLRRGEVYYRRSESQSDLRIVFTTKKEDDTPEMRYREDLFFDGVWRTHIDYQGRTVQKHQLTPADEPIDALELVSQNVPIFGFSDMNSLQDTYAIELLPPGTDEPENWVHLRLVPDADAQPANEYRSVDVWLDSENWLPTRVEAENQDEDIYRLQFPALKLNQEMDDATFEVKIPKGFGTPEVIPLD